MSTSTANAIGPLPPLVTDTDASDGADDNTPDLSLTPQDTPIGSSSPVTTAAWVSHAAAEMPSLSDLALGAAAASPPSLVSTVSTDGGAIPVVGGDAPSAAFSSPVGTNQTDGLNSISDTADEDVKGDAARTTYDVDGTGIKIGIISDSFNSDGLASEDEADGALPSAADVTILKDAKGTDEGRAMAELVHSIAPGAQIYFYAAGNSDQSMAQAITALQQAGCQIIVDDVTFFDEPFYEQGGTISAAVDQATAAGTAYFTSAGNSAESFYEGVFNPIAAPASGGGTVEAEDFNVAGAPEPYYEPLTLPIGASAEVDLQWAQPFLTADGAGNGSGSANSLAYEIFSSTGAVVAIGNVNEVGGDPIQLGSVDNNTKSTTLYLAIFENSTLGPTPGEFKIIIDDNSFNPVVFGAGGGVGSGTTVGHESDPNAITVGAAPENSPTQMEVFSSAGPGLALLDANGNPLAAPESDDKIDVVGVDGNATTVPGFGNFYGTSAAAPTVAAVGALMLEANSLLDPDDIANLLEDTATPMAGAADLTGAGLVNALGAVGAAETLILTETAAIATLAGTHLNDTFVGGPGSHAIDGEGGTNTLDYSAAPAAVTVNFSTGTATNGYGGTDTFANIQIVKGSAFADDFVSGASGETIYGGGGADTVDFSALGTGCVLALDGGTFTASAGSGTNAGIIDIAAACSLTVGGALDNTGSLVVNGGALTLAGAVSGAGTALVENGGVLQIGGADGAGASFGSGAATIALLDPSGFGGTIGGLALGDTIDFVSLGVTGGTIENSILTITESGGATLTFSVAGQLSGDAFSTVGDGNHGTDLTLSEANFGLAAATIDAPATINLGNTRVGGTLATTLGITNSGLAPAEALDASLGGTTGRAIESGSVTLLGDGNTDSGDIAVGLGTGSGGAASGTVTLNFYSDGTGTDNLGITSLGSQTVSLTGGVYNAASPIIGTLPANFIVHVGDHVAQVLSLTNTAPANGYSENLTASLGGTTGGITAQGSPGEIAAGATSNALTLSFATATAGTVSGSVTLNLQSDGTGIDGLGAVSLGQQTVTVNATVDNFAKSVLQEVSGGGTFTAKSATSYTLTLGTVARGATPLVVDLGVLNGAVGPADLLAGSLSASTTSGFTVGGIGNFAGLGAGQADDQPTVTLNTGTGGSFTETITLSSTGSNSSGYSGALANVVLTITGTVATSSAWNGPSASNRSGNFNTAADWSTGVVPNSLMAAVISTAGTYTVTSTQSNSVGTLTLSDGAATLAVAGGTFGVLGASTDAGTIAVGDGATLQLTGTLTNNGSVTLNSAGDATALAVAGSAILKGSGHVTLGAAATNEIISNGAAATLTNSQTIAGSGSIGDANLSVVNSAGAVINANGATAGLTLTGRGIGNSGLIEATAAAGLTIANETITGSGVGAISAAGGNVYLAGATLNAGTLETSNGGTIETLSGTNTLSGVTSSGTVSVSDGTSLRLLGTITNTGAITLNSTGDATDLVIAAATTVKGTGRITLGDNAGNAIVSNGVAETLTNSQTIAGSGTIGDSFLSIVNSAGAIVDATGTAAALTLTGTKGLTNNGLIESTGSAGLVIANTTIGGATGTISASGGNVYVQTTTISTGTLSAIAGTIYLQNATVNGGTVSASGGTVALQGATIGAATLQTSTGGTIATGAGTNTLSGSTITGTVSVTDGTALGLKGTVTDNGAITLNSTGSLMIAAATTLKGSGTITLGDSGGNSIVSNGVAETLTNETTIAGSGTIGDSFLTLTNYTGGTIDATGGTTALTLGGTKTVTNDALIEATGSAGLIITATVSQTATAVISAAGGDVYVQGATITAGTLLAASGNVYLQGGATTGTGTTVSASGGTVYLQGATIGAGTLQTSTGGAIATGAGTNTLSGSTITGTVSVTDGTALGLKGTVTDNGAITLNTAGSLMIAAATTLKGSGTITLGDSGGNSIVSNGVAETLSNQTTIAGSGTIGDSFLTLTNAVSGVIDATGTAAALKLGGTKTYANSGLIEATGSAGLIIAATITGAGGVIAAAGGNILLEGATLNGDSLRTSGGVIETVSGTNTLSGIASTGTIQVTDNTSLTLKGTIADNGVIGIDSTGHATKLIAAAAVTLAGTGAVTMTDNANNSIVTSGTNLTLTNDETISGSGTIGDTHLTLVNSVGATIDATGTAAGLTIATTGHTVTNSGLIETTGSAGLTISGALANNGTLAASGGTLTVTGAVTGTGQATIAGSTLDFASTVAATQAVSFAQNATGLLDLGLAQSFAGTVAGLAGNDAIDLQNFLFGNGPSVTGVAAIMQGINQIGAAVTVKDGALTATLDLLNQGAVQYTNSAGDYTLASDGKAGSPGTLLEFAPHQV